jgi:hypothetical protein
MATETVPERADIEMAAARLAAVYLVLCELKTKLSSRIIPPLPQEIRSQAFDDKLLVAISRIYTDSPPNLDLNRSPRPQSVYWISNSASSSNSTSCCRQRASPNS